MQVRTAVIAWAILFGCGGARNSGGGVAATSSQASTTPPATPASPSDTPQPTPAAPPDATPAPPPSPPAPPPPAWAGTQTLAAPWTELDGVATIPGGGLVMFGSQFLVKDGSGNRHGTVAWADPTGSVKRALGLPDPDDIFGMAVSASGAIALGGYTQGDGGYLLVLDKEGAQKWLASMGPSVAIYGVAFALNGDVVASGSDPKSFIGRWAPDGTLLWRKSYPVEADGFSFGLALTPSGDIAAAGGRGPVFVLRSASDGTTLWTRSLDLGSPSSSQGAIATDAAGAALLAGRNGNDAFVLKLDSAGETAWQQAVATDGVNTANGIAVDAAGNAVVVGSYGLGSGGSGTGYVARYDASGKRVWMTDVNWPGIEVLNAVTLDGAGNAYVVGSFPSDASGFQKQGFLAKVDRAGALQ